MDKNIGRGKITSSDPAKVGSILKVVWSW